MCRVGGDTILCVSTPLTSCTEQKIEAENEKDMEELSIVLSAVSEPRPCGSREGSKFHRSGWVGVGFFCVVLCFCRDPSDCPFFVLVWSVLHWLSKLWSGMGSDGQQTQRKIVDPG